MIFRLRGMSKEEVLEALRKKRASGEDNAPAVSDTGKEVDYLKGLEQGDFWAGPGIDGPLSFNIAPPELDGTVIRRMGTPAFWDAGESFAGIMTEYYARISKKAMDVAYSDYEIHEGDAAAGTIKKTRKKRKPEK